jgi:hypothetical protein
MLRLTRSGPARLSDRAVLAAAPLLLGTGAAMAMGCCAAMAGLGDAPNCGGATMSPTALAGPAEICVHVLAISAALSLAALATMMWRAAPPGARHAAAA